MRSIRLLELLSWVAGITLLGFSATHWALAEVERRDDLARFEALLSNPDQSLWSEERIAAWEEERRAQQDEMLAVLTMPGLNLQVPVYPGSGDSQLDLGAGLIPGTAQPWEDGNVGIAGHRDGYFRVLKDVQVGERLTLQTGSGTRVYRVTETTITDPWDVDVLQPTATPSVTLVTCYPFYFVGSAPERFIVRAELDENLVNH